MSIDDAKTTPAATRDDGGANILLKGKDLVCWCAPERCHCDAILRKASWGLK